MAMLSSEIKDNLAQMLLDALSADWEQVPVGHQQVRAALDVFDEQLNTCEQDILAVLPAGAQTWLVAHQTIGRQIMIAVEQARKETL